MTNWRPPRRGQNQRHRQQVALGPGTPRTISSVNGIFGTITSQHDNSRFLAQRSSANTNNSAGSSGQFAAGNTRGEAMELDETAPSTETERTRPIAKKRSPYGRRVSEANAGQSCFSLNMTMQASNPFGGSSTASGSGSLNSLFGGQRSNTPTGGLNTNPFGGVTQNQTSQTAGNTSGIFGNLNQNQAQAPNATTPSLFASVAGASQSTTTGSIFGSAATGNQTQQQQQQQPAAGGRSLFDRITPASSQPAAPLGTGLFQNATATSQPQQQQSFLQLPQPATSAPSLFSGGGIFGGQPTNQAQTQTTQAQHQQAQAFGAGSSMFGGQPNLGSTTFGGQGQTQDSQGQGSLAASSTNAHFHTLLERGKRRREGFGTSNLTDIPEIQFGLGDISSKLRKIGGADSVLSRDGDATAGRLLLATSGVPMKTTLKDLDSFSAKLGATAPRPPVDPSDADVEGFVTGILAKRNADIVKDSLEETNKEFDRFMQDNLHINWEEQKRRIYEHFGLKKPGEIADEGLGATATTRGAFGKSSRRAGGKSQGAGSFRASASRSVLGGSVAKTNSSTALFSDVAEKTSSIGIPSAVEDPWLRSKQEKYAAKVKELNSARVREEVYPVIEEFARVETEAGGDTPAHLIDAYRAIKEITKENPNAQRPSEPGAVRERQYAQDYLDDAPNSSRSTAIRKQILDGSRKFLEDSFYQQVEDTISKNPREANMGGVPTKLNKVRAYVRLRSARKSLGTDVDNLQMLGDDYCWVLIFFLIRAGLIDEAAKYVSDNERAIKSMDRHLVTYLMAFAKDPDRRLPRDMQPQINAIYQQRTRIAPDNSIDPYRMACYKIVGRCDLSRRNIEGIHVGLEDWIWILFSLAREVNRAEETASEVFGLDDVRAMVSDVGERHFGPNSENNSNYATYFLLLALAGMFEKSISWLYPHNYVAAVHFAIALDFYGMLRVSNFDVSESQLLTYTTREKPQISFARLLGYYTRDFRLARPEAATDYLTLICLNVDLPGNAGEAQAAVCHEALKELVLETREFAQLLGDMREDGRRVPGAIEHRLKLINLNDNNEFMKQITMQAAGVANDNGRTTDAVLLFHLAEEYDSVMAIVNRAMSEAVMVEIGRDPMRLQPLKPRALTTDPQNQQQANGNGKQQQGPSLSVSALDDPIVIAKHFIQMYNSNALYYGKIQQVNRDAAGKLLRMSEAKGRIEAGRWAEAFDAIQAVDILPVTARGDISVVRAAAQTFNALPTVVARNVGNLLMWTIQCCGKQRDNLRNSAFDKNNRALSESLSMIAKDMMVFAGLIRYKLPPDVFEVLARAGQDVASP